MPRQLRVDDGRFPSETLDGETVVIDTVTGQVVVFDGVASMIWQILRVGVDVDELETACVERYGAASRAIVSTFVDAVRDGEMVVPVTVVERLPDDLAWPQEFAAPVLERFDGLVDLLTVDPIHDVDPATGWPRVR